MSKKYNKTSTSDSENNKYSNKTINELRRLLQCVIVKMPLVIFSISDVKTDITIDNITSYVDDCSWIEFFPDGFTKEDFNNLKKYYNSDMFKISARVLKDKICDVNKYDPIERVDRIVNIFKTFNNPDKETVLTPWSVISNIHLSRFLDNNNDLIRDDVRFLDINAKSGLYPLYLAKRIFEKSDKKSHIDHKQLWQNIINDNIYVLCKTDMAKRIVSKVLSYDGITNNILSYSSIIKNVCNTDKYNDDILHNAICDDIDSIVDNINETFGVSSVKFDAVVGNPPYQKRLGGTNNIDIWPEFVRSATKLGKKVSIIAPARWVVPKVHMIKTRDMLIESGLKSFRYYKTSSDIFNNTAIDGGVAIINLEDGYYGKIDCYIGDSSESKEYDVNDIFLSDKYEEEIYKKVTNKYDLSKNMLNRVKGNIGSLGGNDFGYAKLDHKQYLCDTSAGMSEPVKIWANPSEGKGTRFDWKYIDRKYLTNRSDYNYLFKTRKIMLDKKGNTLKTSGTANIINNQPEILEKNTIGSIVLLVIPEKDDDYHLKLIQSMFKTRTFRFLMTLKQKDLYVRGFELIPDYTLFIDSLNGQLFTDEWCYKHFGFSDDLIKYIEDHVSSK